MNKNIRKILFGIGVSGLALGASAFTNGEVEKASLQDGLWFEYEEVAPGAELNPANYERIGDGTTAPSCNEGTNLCAVQAQPHPDNEMQPDLSTIQSSRNKQ